MGATTIVVIHGNHASRAGNFFRMREACPDRLVMPVGDEQRDPRGNVMPRGRSTFTKRQKEHTRQQRQRDKAERRNQRKQEGTVGENVDEMAELRKHAAEQAALFNVGTEDTDTAEQSSQGDHLGE